MHLRDGHEIECEFLLFFFVVVIFLQVNMEVDDYGLSILKYRTNGQALE